MKKIISIILVLLMTMGIIIIPSKSKASISIDEAYLYSKGTYTNYLHWGPIGLIFDYVVYEKDGQEYPAYCLNKDLTGVKADSPYSVNIDDLLTNVEVWRTIINGYPYKTYQELGCANREEAFMATKQAVYCMIYGRDPEKYVAKTDIAVRVRNALIKIVTDAKNSTEVKQSADLRIEEVSNNWEINSIDNTYVSKKFTVKANSTINTYLAELEGMNVEGAKIVDENNNEKTEFNYGENFKIIIPIKNMTDEGSFNIKVNGKVATKPILYGYSGNPNLQDYALTGNIYEDGSGIKTVYYTKNETKIIILKQDEDGNALEGVKFRLLNENKDVLHTELTTNKEGKIIIENLNPGVYYLEETSTVNGYAVYGEQIEAKVDYNEALTITVTNSKETIEVEKPEITEKQQEVVVKLPKTGM